MFIDFVDEDEVIRLVTPQGSILKPKLFISYITDICNVSDVV